MELNHLINLLKEQGIDAVATSELSDVAFSHITEDSRKVTHRSIFVAVSGEHLHGYDYVDAAVSQGAVAIIGQRSVAELSGYPAHTPYIQVPHARQALGCVAHALVDFPSRSLQVVGITGTNGKSSTAMMIHHILQHAGHNSACLGTLGYSVGGAEHEASRTTPFPEDLANLFKQAYNAGDTHLVMEVSSHALEQDRVAGIEFDVAVFTNLSQDHLDYHSDMETYLNEKLKLFKKLDPLTGISIANSDDDSWGKVKAASEAQHISFGVSSDVSASEIKMKNNRTQFKLKTPWGNSPCDMALLGHHNISNALAAVSVCGQLGVYLEQLKEGLKTLPVVPGRFEAVDAAQDFQVVVDYAHTDDGLLNVLKVSRELCENRLIVIFGCGGDRDKSKRPKMAAVAAQWGDYSIITSDNPRSESPERILMDVEVGMQHAGKKRDVEYTVIEDRKEAIHAGMAMAQKGDLIMIAGKGHEDYQILNEGTIHFDDREVAREWLEGHK